MTKSVQERATIRRSQMSMSLEEELLEFGGAVCVAGVTLKVQDIGQDREAFFLNPFSVANFWFERQNIFPKSYRIAMRVLATPVSSS